MSYFLESNVISTLKYKIEWSPDTSCTVYVTILIKYRHHMIVRCMPTPLITREENQYSIKLRYSSLICV